jgi:hypothetical protein
MSSVLDMLGRAVGAAASFGKDSFNKGFYREFLRPSTDKHTNTPGGAQQERASSKDAPKGMADREPKSMFDDPYDVFTAMGYKDRPSSVTYDTLRDLLYRVPVVSGIIQVRTEQVAAFGHVVPDRYGMGFRVRLRDKDEKPTQASKDLCRQCEQFLLRTGLTNSPQNRDSFETYLRKITRDSLTFDQDCTEIVPANDGRPAEFYAIDAGNIRIAQNVKQFLSDDVSDETAYVEVYQEAVRAEYTSKELIFGVRNPSTDIRLCGYGVSEMELLLTTVTQLLNAWNYNANFFTNGTQARGVLNIREENISAQQLNQFEKRWNAMLRGTENSWRVPVMNAKDGVEWINMQGASDVQFQQWMDLLIKLICSQYKIAPEELNLRYGNINQTSAMSESSNKDKITDSKERGLRPLLRHFSGNLNKHLIWPFSEAVELEFCGLDAMGPEEKSDFNNKRVRSYMTVNEIRAEDDMPALVGGNVILDASYMASLAQATQGPMLDPSMDGVQVPDIQPAQDSYGQPQQDAQDDVADDQGGYQDDAPAYEDSPAVDLQQSMPAGPINLRKSAVSVDIQI